MKVFLDMVGCRLNQAELEQMARQFRSAGHTLVGQALGADMVVVNTCAVTEAAASDSRQKIRHAANMGVAEIIATGCWSTLVPQQALALPGVTRVVPNDRKEALVDEVLGIPAEIFDNEPLARRPLPGLRRRTRAFIKVQDGCDNRCTFCITTVARGAGRSRSIPAVLEDIRLALEGGAREVVLTGVHLGSWGQDLSDGNSGSHLRELVKVILADTDVPRLRLSSLEPWDLDEDFFSLWENPRLMPHLHLPLQSGSESTLRRMLRKTTPDSFRRLVESARSLIPDVAITTDVIAGFPGETDEEFSETTDFVREIRFAGGHIFTYSARPGTAAARIKSQVPHEVRKHRNHLLRDVFIETATDYRKSFLGRSLAVLWEAAAERDEQGWKMEGLTGNYIRVTAVSPELRWNQIDHVKLSSLKGEDVLGVIQQPSV